MKAYLKPLVKMSSWIFFSILLATSLFLGFFSSSKPTTSTNTRAATTMGGKTITVSGTGAKAIQQAFDSAQNGDTIMIPAGTYSDNTTTPLGLGDDIYVSAGRGASSTCFARLEKKNVTIKGPGAIIFGEGHDSKAGVEPYIQRAGLCIIESNVTIDNLRIKEFQKRCVVVYNSTIIVKNSIIEGCDEGGVSLLGNSSGLFVNNMFAEMNFGAVMLWQSSTAKIVNNIFHNAAVLFFYHYPHEQLKAEVINNIFTGIKSTVAQVDWWKATDEQKKLNTLSYNLFWNERPECDRVYQFWCDAFPGKIYADPLYVEPVTDPRGIANWANFGFREGSPAVGVGDPSIPGTKNLGNAGGPCVDPSASICTNYIAQNAPKPPEPPTPTLAPTDIPQPTTPIEEPPVPPSDDTSHIPEPGRQSSSSPPIDLPIGSQNKTSSLFIVENLGFGTVTIQGIQFKDRYVPVNKKMETGESVEYPLGNVCKSADETMQGSVLYVDENGGLSFPSLTIYCYKNNVFDIQ